MSNEGQYQVTVAGDPALCDTLFTVNLAYYPPLQIGFTDLNAISCFGENDGSASLSISGPGSPYTYAWSDNIDHGDQASGLTPGNYSVEITDVNGCKADTSFQINEPPPVAISASADSLICFGSSSDLIADASGGTGDFAYHWNHTPSVTSTSTVNPTEDSVYTVYATDENGCTTDTVALDVVVINTYPDSLQVSADGPVCAGGEVSLSASYQGQYPPYSYSWSNGLPDGPGPFTVSPDSTTSYTVSVSDNCGNEVSKDIPVTIWSLPVANMDSLANVTCAGLNNGTAAISVSEGTPAFTFNWSDGQDHGADANGLMPGTYDVEISDVHGCETTIAFSITEPLPLEISLTGDTLICPGESASLSAAATGGSPDITFNWNDTIADSGMVVVTPSGNTVYSVYAEDANGCTTDPLEIAVTVMNMDPGFLTVSNDTSICPGQSASLFGNYSGNFPPYQYTWSDSLGAGQGPYLVSPDEPTSYTLTVTDICMNALSANVDVDLYENPEVVLPDELISGCSPLNVNLFDSLNTGPGYTHKWIFSDSTSLFGNPANLALEDPGVYQVTLVVTNPEGCSAASGNTLPVEVYPLPSAYFGASTWSTGIDQSEIHFTDQSTGSVYSVWDIDNDTFENQTELDYTFTDTGYFAVRLTVENEFGCRDSVLNWVTITIDHTVEIPNAFTPGDKGADPFYDPHSLSNSVFYPFAEYVVDYKMSVFNRWGELIFESSEKEKGWNGTYRDEPCPQDVYVYKVDLVYADGEKVTRVGDVTLFR